MAARGGRPPPRRGSTRQRPAAAAPELEAVFPQAPPAGDPPGARAPAAAPAATTASAASGRSAGGGEEADTRDEAAAPANCDDGNVYWVKLGARELGFKAVTIVALTGAFAEQLTQTISTTHRVGLSAKARPCIDWARAVCGPEGVDSPAGEAVFWLPCRAAQGTITGRGMYRAVLDSVAHVIQKSTELTRRQAQNNAQAKKRAKKDGTYTPRFQFGLIGHTARSRQAEHAPEDWSYACSLQMVRGGRPSTLVGGEVAGGSWAEPSGAAAAAPEGSSGPMQGAQVDSQASAPSQRQLHDPQPHAALRTADPDCLHGAAWKESMLGKYNSPPAGFLITMPDATLQARGEAWPYDLEDPFAEGARGRSAFREAFSAWVAAGASDGRARVQRRTAESKPKSSPTLAINYVHVLH